ncbi:NRT1 PTR FAMILY -like [Olea europaea subsp. europaea]|uniref:NRT1 PTR FAMILY -like n=1 Tax=Olea europaea subsp. europaea TaxID=158383 RepID=A0A8S0QX86_OLEEU|nr:NRT1 PTR FAMILY -like [Olea europaea subsp. europaea]
MALETELLPMFTAVEGDYNSDDNVVAAEKDGIHELSKSLNCKPATNICVEYAIVIGLHTGLFSEGDRYTNALEKRRLKEKYFKSLEKISCAQLKKTFVRASIPRADRYKLGLALIVEGVITAPDNNVGTDEDTLSLVDDLKLFFRTPRPKSVIGPQFHEVAPTSAGHEGSTAGDGHDDEFGTGTEDDETSMSDDRQTSEGNDDDGSKADDSGDSGRDTSSKTDVLVTPRTTRMPQDGSRVHYPFQWLARPHLGCKVLVAAISGRAVANMSTTEAGVDGRRHGRGKAENQSVSEYLKFLNRALMGTSAPPWHQCTTKQVEEVKIVLKILPIFMSTIMLNCCLAQLSTFSVQQAATMNTKVGALRVPPASLPVFPMLFIMILAPVYNHPTFRNVTNTETGITHLQRTEQA